MNIERFDKTEFKLAKAHFDEFGFNYRGETPEKYIESFFGGNP